MRDSDTLPKTSAADDAFDLALVNAAVLTLVAITGLVGAGITDPIPLAGLTLAGLVFVFIVTPHVAARWLGRDVDELLGTTPAARSTGQSRGHRNNDHHE